jgi:hypothetical protein
MDDFVVRADDEAPPEGGAPLVEFLCPPELYGRIPEPERAIRFAPEWFRQLPREMGMTYATGLPALTAKGCLPMTDAFALGFVIPLPFEVRFTVDAWGNARPSWAEGLPFNPIERHHPGQLGAPAPPFGQMIPFKFVNPWRIKVPDGYSLLFSHPLNRPELPFACFSGLVDCDRFDTTVNFPFLWTGVPGEHVLPAGTPIAQLIPIRRDSLLKDSTARPSTAEELAEQDEAKRRKYGEQSAYAREWRVKK